LAKKGDGFQSLSRISSSRTEYRDRASESRSDF